MPLSLRKRSLACTTELIADVGRACGRDIQRPIGTDIVHRDAGAPLAASLSANRFPLDLEVLRGQGLRALLLTDSPPVSVIFSRLVVSATLCPLMPSSLR